MVQPEPESGTLTALRLHVEPVELREANAFIEQHHRHHPRVQGHRWSIGAVDEDGTLHAVAVVGRPTSGLDPKALLEVTRMCSDGTPNACSILYGAAARAGKALGFRAIQTYIFDSEDGASLKASGWRYVRKAHPNGRHRKRSDGEARSLLNADQTKTLWRKTLHGEDTDEYGHHRRSD